MAFVKVTHYRTGEVILLNENEIARIESIYGRDWATAILPKNPPDPYDKWLRVRESVEMIQRQLELSR